MKVLRLNLDKYLTTTLFDPSPHRIREEEKPVSERRLPVIYTCENCDNSISFSTEDFEKHNKSHHTNLKPADKKLFDDFIKKTKLKDYSFLDFYCPRCNQATTFVFNGGSSGYWGDFEFKISNAFVIKILSKGKIHKLLEKLLQMIARR